MASIGWGIYVTRKGQVTPVSEYGKSNLSNNAPDFGKATGTGSTVRIPVRMLVPSDSPRLDGISFEHADILAELDGGSVPPILVHRSSMRVIDGMHRLRAAMLRGDDEIDVQFFDGHDHDAFVEGVRANITHGLPLTLADRTAAAARIIRTHPQWSDRVIGVATGLSAKTVSTLRAQSSEQGRSDRRIGRDGRVRPVDAAQGRRLASAFIAENPDASLREIARAAGVAPSTALHVRNQIRKHRDPDVEPQSRRARRTERNLRRHLDPEPPKPIDDFDRESAIQILCKDPALRLSEVGRALLRQLNINPLGLIRGTGAMGYVPPHCAAVIAKLARDNAQAWSELAHHLDQLGERTSSPSEA
jgi:ParB-like chromosome segregation protein Spo0J